jgi:L-malate glycosyltransferase
MMRIAVVGWHGSVHIRRFARFFADAGHEVHVVTCGGADATDELIRTSARYEVHELGLPVLGRIGYVAKIPRARRLLRALRPDVVHAHTATSYGMIAMASGLRPVVVTTHGSDIFVSTRYPVLRQIVRRTLSRADLVTAPADHVRRAIEELLGEGAPEILVLQYGVETDRLVSLGVEVRAGREESATRRLVTARPLTPLYDTGTIIRSLALLPAEWRLDVAGDGPERRRLEALVVELGIADRVTFHGLVTGEAAIHRLIASADIYVSMARSDGVSIALLEALALGTIPVLRDIPANRLWIDDGVTGVVTSSSAEAVAGAVLRAAALDPEVARRTSARLVRERADRATNLGLLLGHFEDLLAAPQPA